MMKIHTTQNLNARDNYQPKNKCTLSHDSKLVGLEYIKHFEKNQIPDSYHENIAFKGKKSIIEKIIENLKRATNKGNINPGNGGSSNNGKMKRTAFDWLLDVMARNEVLTNAIISALVCVILRPLTIVVLPNKEKDKKDNFYAGAHSVASGFTGIFTALLITTPFSRGVKFSARDINLMKRSEAFLKKYYPNLDLNSIYTDATKKIRKPVSEWIDKEGRKFSKDFKNVMKMARPQHASVIEEETWKSIGVDVDVNAMKGKSLNEWVTRDGKSLRDAMDTKDMILAIKEEGMGGSIKDAPDTNFFSLKYIDKDFLKEMIKDSDKEAWKKLDINSIDKNGKRLHPKEWKNTDGTPFELDMDTIHVSSYLETEDKAIPVYTGRKRIDKGKEKYVSYQRNINEDNGLRLPDEVGTAVTQECVEAGDKQEILDMILKWIPDLATRAFVASATVAIIPIVLKKVFNIEKKPKTQQQVTPPIEVKPSGKEVA